MRPKNSRTNGGALEELPDHPLTPAVLAKGRLNGTLVALARTPLGGYHRAHRGVEGWDVETELARHQWADALVMQFPVSWMGTPWSSRDMDEVYTAGMDGRLCRVDGAEAPVKITSTGSAARSPTRSTCSR